MSEQAFFRFRGQAGTFNDRALQACKLYVLANGCRQNLMVSKDDVAHLNQYAMAKMNSQPCKALKRPGSETYICAPKSCCCYKASTGIHSLVEVSIGLHFLVDAPIGIHFLVETSSFLVETSIGKRFLVEASIGIHFLLQPSTIHPHPLHH